MSRIAYVNGRYLAHADASVHIEDRGYQFADGVYEVVSIAGGKLADLQGHLTRLARSLKELRMAAPVSERVLQQIMRRMVCKNLIRDGLLYIQITRGVARRDFVFPEQTAPSLVMTCAHRATWRAEIKPVRVITVPDQRWARCDIKTVSLLAPVLAKQTARDAGAFEAWMVDQDGFVTEAASANAWIVTGDKRIITRKPTNAILKGITRGSVLSLAAGLGMRFEERSFTPEEAYEAQEAFVTSATTFVTPVNDIDGHRIGNGEVGPVATALRKAYLDYMAATGQ